MERSLKKKLSLLIQTGSCAIFFFIVFAIVMTVLLFDASAKFAMEFAMEFAMVYADDTLVVATDPCRAETHMRCIEAMGMNYGLASIGRNARYCRLGAKSFHRSP